MVGKIVMIRGGFMSLHIWTRSKSWDGVSHIYGMTDMGAKVL